MPEPRRAGPRIAPAVVVLAVLGGAAVWTLGRSVRTEDGIGLAHYTWILGSQLSTVVNTVVWVFVVVVGTVVSSTLLALLLGRSRGAGVAVGLVLVPAGITLTGVAVAWRLAFAFRPSGRAQAGVVNEVVTTVGVSPVSWLTQEPLVNTVVLATALVWTLTGLALLVLVPAVRAIPRELVDRARREGRSAITIARRIIVPSIRGPIAVVALLSAVAAVRAHDIVRVATGGAFGTGVLATESVDRSFVDGQPGRGAALAVVMLVLVVPAMALAARWWARRGTAVVHVRPVPRHRALGRRGRHSAPPPEAEQSPPQPGRRPGALGPVVGVAAVAVWSVPAIGVVLTGLRPAGSESGWWPVVTDPTLTLENLRRVLGDGADGGMWSATLDSLAVAVPAVAVTLALGWLTAEAMTAWRGGRRSLLQGALVVAAILPFPVVLHPLSEATREVGLDGTLPAIWLAHIVVGTPLVALLMTVARERTAGSAVGAAPALVAVAALHLVWVWNDYLLAVAFLGGEGAEITPATVRLAELVSTWGQRPELLAAAAVVALAVPLAVLLSARGLVTGVLTTPAPPEGVAAEPQEDPDLRTSAK